MCNHDCQCKSCNHQECKCPSMDDPENKCLYIRLDGQGLQECSKDHKHCGKNAE